MAETKAVGIKSRGIKKIFYCLLISGLILGLSGGVNAYSPSGTAGTCICGNGNTELGGSDTDACWDCNYALDDASCVHVLLNASIADYHETCIYDYGNFNNKVFDCRENTISGNGSSDSMGIYLLEQSGNTIKNCVITGFDYGIYLHSSSGNTIANNTVNSNTQGIYLYVSADNNLTGNSVNMNMYGIYLESLSIVMPSSNNIMRNNIMSNNTYNFNPEGYDASDYYQDIDTSNLVDDKPIYYLTETINAQIPGDAGFVGLISCENITVKDLNLSNNFYGILLMNTINSEILNNTLSLNEMGISLEQSPGNKLRNNTMINNTYNLNVLGNEVLHYIQDIDDSNTAGGKHVYYWTGNSNAKIPVNAGFAGLVSCENITIENLNLSENSHGILLVNTTNSRIFNNTLHSNIFGIYLDSSGNNELKNNNMSNNSYNFNVIGTDVSYYNHSVDTSNTVDEKPIYYWTGNSSVKIPEDAGFAALISCNNITVENLNISSNFQGILLVDMINSKILNNTLYSNVNGIYLDSSSNNLIANNTLASNSNEGILLYYSLNNNITENTMLNSCYGDGISLKFSTQNAVSENTISGNLVSGIYVDRSDGGNLIFNNTILESAYGIYVENSDGGMTDNAKNRSYEWYSCDMSNAGVYNQTSDFSLEYSLPWPFTYSGRNITKLSVSTNGFIELLESGEDCYNPGDGCDWMMHSEGLYKGNSDVIFAFGDYLQQAYLTDEDYLAVCNMSDKIVIGWHGSTVSDYSNHNNNSEGYTINFQIVMYPNGTIQWNFNEMNWEGYYYKPFSGLYAKEENLEVTTGNAIRTQGSYYYIQNLSSAVRMGTVTGNNVTNNKYGIYLNSSSLNILLENSILNNNVGIYSENSSSTVNSNFVCYNTESDFNSTSWLSTGDNNTCDNADGWNDTETTGCTESCPQICHCNSCGDCTNKLNNNSCQYVILNGSITNHSGTCINFPANNKVFDCDGNAIDGDKDYGGGIGISLNGKSNNIVKNCVITDFGSGISLYSSSNNIIINNTANSNNYSGIGLESSSNNIIINNTANSNIGFYNNGYYYSGNGIFLGHFSNNNTLANNTANSNNEDGIYLFDNSNFNKIFNNKIFNNKKNGIETVGCYYACPGYGSGSSSCNLECDENKGNTHNILEGNEISGNNIGIYSQDSNSTINSNIVCGNIESDFNSTDWLSSTGDNNTCEKSGIWSDDSTTGCTDYCFFSPCDLNHDGIYVNDRNDLMAAYKCFLGVEKDCEKIGFGDWSDIKREYLCFVNN